MKSMLESRRERVVYIICGLTIAFGVFCVFKNVSLLEATSFSSPILALAGYYVKNETERQSKTISKIKKPPKVNLDKDKI